jgi:hypothetical protein
LDASSAPNGLPDGFDFLSNAVIHSYSLPFVSEIVQRAPLLISGFFQALGEAWLGFSVENEFVLLAAISIPYQIFRQPMELRHLRY